MGIIIILCFVEIVSTLIFYNIMFEDCKKVFSVRDGLLAIVLSTIYLIMSRILDINNVLSLVTILLIGAIIKCYKQRSELLIKFIKIILTSILVLSLELIGSFIMYIVVNPEDIKDIYYLAYLVVMMTIGFLLIKKVKDKYMLKINSENLKVDSIFIIIFNMFTFFMFIKVLSQYGIMESDIIIQITLLAALIITINIAYLIYLNKKRQIEKRNQIKEAINPLIDELMNKMRATEHEYKNHLNILYCMIQVCEEDELKKRAKSYVGNIVEKNNILTRISKIENTILKAMLFSKVQEAEKMGTLCTFNVESNLENIPLDDSELTVVLSNLLNNAIEATATIDNKIINIFIGEDETKYIIRVNNTIDEKSVDVLSRILKERISTKGSDRGYGLANIKSIVDKYKGKLTLEVDEEMVEFEIVIDI